MYEHIVRYILPPPPRQLKIKLNRKNGQIENLIENLKKIFLSEFLLDTLLSPFLAHPVGSATQPIHF